VGHPGGGQNNKVRAGTRDSWPRKRGAGTKKGPTKGGNPKGGSGLGLPLPQWGGWAARPFAPGKADASHRSRFHTWGNPRFHGTIAKRGRGADGCRTPVEPWVSIGKKPNCHWGPQNAHKASTPKRLSSGLGRWVWPPGPLWQHNPPHTEGGGGGGPWGRGFGKPPTGKKQT